MADIRVTDTTIVVEESSHMHGLIDLKIQQYDPNATLTSYQARQLAETLTHYAEQADGFE